MTKIFSLLSFRIAVGIAFAGPTLLAPQAFAALTIVAEETGGNVVFTFSGSLNLPAPSATIPAVAETYLNPMQGAIAFRQATGSADRFPFVSMVPFGTGDTQYNVGIGAGDNIGVYSTELYLNEDYISGDPLSATLTFPNTTLAALGVDASGSPYVWTIAGSNDTITLRVTQSAGAKMELSRKIKKLEKKAKKLKKKSKKAKAKKLLKKAKKLKKQLAAL